MCAFDFGTLELLEHCALNCIDKGNSSVERERPAKKGKIDDNKFM